MTQQQNTQSEQELIERENEWYAALAVRNATNVNKLRNILADDYTNTDAEGTVWTKDSDISNFENGLYEVQSLNPLEDPIVRVYGNTAVVTGADKVSATFRGVDVSGAYRWTDTWVKESGAWLCVASHGSRITYSRELCE